MTHLFIFNVFCWRHRQSVEAGEKMQVDNRMLETGIEHTGQQKRRCCSTTGSTWAASPFPSHTVCFWKRPWKSAAVVAWRTADSSLLTLKVFQAWVSVWGLTQNVLEWHSRWAWNASDQKGPAFLAEGLEMFTLKRRNVLLGWPSLCSVHGFIIVPFFWEHAFWCPTTCLCLMSEDNEQTAPHRSEAVINLDCLEEIKGHDAKIIWLSQSSARAHYSLNKSIMNYWFQLVNWAFSR